MKFLRLVTVTGADDSNNINDLYDVSEKYPFAEFGLLLCPGHTHKPRWPSVDWLQRLSDTDYKKLHLSCHLCGSYVNIALEEGTINIPAKLEMFSRIQLNTHGVMHRYNLNKLVDLVSNLGKNNVEVIFQYDSMNTKMIQEVKDAGCKNISALYDMSHGAGKLPNAWEKLAVDIPAGYAGGLSAMNLDAQLEQICRLGYSNAWVDAETRLRSKDDAYFDIKFHVEPFLKIAKPYVL